jgi:hypothetical protein
MNERSLAAYAESNDSIGRRVAGGRDPAANRWGIVCGDDRAGLVVLPRLHQSVAGSILGED